MRKSWFSLVVMGLFVGVLTGNALAQHHHHHRQKAGQPESGQPPTPESAGYVAPTPTGTREGATGGVGINGPSIELPALSLKLPSIRIPGLTRFTTPPHMRVKQTVAPLVNEARQEFSFDAGQSPSPESGLPPGGSPESGQPAGPPSQKEFQKSFQKAGYDDCPECQRELQQLARAESDDALEQRLSRLESSLGQLVEGLEAIQARTVQQLDQGYLQPFPAVTVEQEFPVSRSSYQTIERLPPRLLPAHVYRLPGVR